MKLREIAFAVPENRVPNADVAQWSGLEESFITGRIGVESRAFLGPEESPSRLAAAACESLLSRPAAPARSQIGLLVLVTQNPDYKIPHSSALLQKELSLSDSTACFDINLGCSGYVYALSIVKGFMLAEGIADALLVTCDPYSRIMGRADRDTVGLFGDAATASWISAGQGAEIGKLDFGTDGQKAEHLIVRKGGAAQPISGIYSRMDASAIEDPDCRLHMNGRGIFNFMMERIPGSVDQVLRKNNLSATDIDYFVFHQGSRFLLDQLRQKLKLPAEKVPSNVAQHGNTVSSSVPLLLAELMSQHGGLKSKKVLVSGFGVGLSWASNILFF